MAADESYPDELKYHREHDWARIVEGDTATLGVTWYAQDALGELVHFEPPDVGVEARAGRELRRGRVREGGLRPDLARSRARSSRSTRRSSTSPRRSTRIPYGEGWLVKVRLSDPGEVDDLLDVQAYKKLLEEL